MAEFKFRKLSEQALQQLKAEGLVTEKHGLWMLTEAGEKIQRGTPPPFALDPPLTETEIALIGTLRLAMVEGDKVDWSVTIEHHGGAYDYSTTVNGKAVGRGTGASVWDAYMNWR